jgi:DNA invertase Pin-like site-specific DNA recombinase
MANADSLAAQVINVFVQLEREQRRKRQREGIEAAKARGVYRGRAFALTDAQVSAAAADIVAGVPKAVIARRLGVARQTLYTALDRRETNGR